MFRGKKGSVIGISHFPGKGHASRGGRRVNDEETAKWASVGEGGGEIGKRGDDHARDGECGSGRFAFREKKGKNPVRTFSTGSHQESTTTTEEGDGKLPKRLMEPGEIADLEGKSDLYERGDIPLPKKWVALQKRFLKARRRHARPLKFSLFSGERKGREQERAKGRNAELQFHENRSRGERTPLARERTGINLTPEGRRESTEGLTTSPRATRIGGSATSS